MISFPLAKDDGCGRAGDTKVGPTSSPPDPRPPTRRPLGNPLTRTGHVVSVRHTPSWHRIPKIIGWGKMDGRLEEGERRPMHRQRATGAGMEARSKEKRLLTLIHTILYLFFLFASFLFSRFFVAFVSEPLTHNSLTHSMTPCNSFFLQRPATYHTSHTHTISDFASPLAFSFLFSYNDPNFLYVVFNTRKGKDKKL